MLDHFSQCFHILNAKYGDGLHLIIAGDSNDLNLNSITQLSPNMKQILTSPSRLNPPAILDPIITTLGQYYQLPVCLPPLGPDLGSGGQDSDHLIVVTRPISTINNKPVRDYRYVTYRLFPESGLITMKHWFECQNWFDIYNEQDIDKKANLLHNMLLTHINEFLPEKTSRFTNDDQP